MKHTGLRQPFLLTALCAAMLMPSAAALAVTDEEILKDATTTDQIVTNGLGLQGQRYSPLATLNTDNIKDLRPVWTLSFGGEKQRGQQAQPLIKDGVMYVTASYSRVFAVDARTGRELWQYDARLPDDIRPCCDVINRGVALYGDLVIFGTLDAKLVALHKDTGKVVWRKNVADHKAGYSITAAPLVVNGKLITGVSGGEFGVVGKIEAYDPKNGELLWTRPTVEGHMGYVYKDGKAVENGISGGEAGKTWPGDLWKTGGAATWQAAYYDPDVDLIFMGTGNPSPWNSWLRPGDNLYSSATVAIDRIYALAAQERITLARGEYSLGVDPKTHLARYQILLPVRGSYPQLRRFLHALLGQLPAVVVEDVEFQRKKIADTDLTGRIRLNPVP